MWAPSCILAAIVLALVQCADGTKIKVNPLPAPRSLVWEETEISRPFDLDAFSNANITAAKTNSAKNEEIVQLAFGRVLDRITTLKWVPATVEVSTYFESFATDEQAQEKIGDPKYSPTKKIREIPPTLGASITKMNIFVEDYDADLQMGVDESYSMSLSGNSTFIDITAKTTWGALHALETFAQLVLFDKQSQKFYIEAGFEILNDSPLYGHRGLLVDSARNFMTVQSLLDQIDILAMAKMNVLHWHFVESQSWPIEMLKYPQMTNDAYSPEEIYTQEDIKKILKYGRERGVRIIPELDMPGHSSSGWRSVDPEIISCGDAFWCQSDKFHTSVEPNPGQLDIIYENTHEVLKDVYGELSGLFDDNLFHVGADEIVADCYNYSTHVQRWFAEDSSRTFRDLIQYWVDKTYPMFTGLKKDRRLIMWEDILTSDISAFNLSEEVIMQVWTNGPVHIKDLTSRGHDVIVSTSDYLYLDCGEASWLPNDPNFIDGFVGTPDTYNYNPGYGSSWCGPYKTYQRIYNYDIAANLTDEEAAHIIGGEVAIWAEQTDSLTLTSMVWPRSAAYAENLWSGNRDESGKRRNFVFTQRILNFREYLVALGFSAKALVPKYCLQHPHACDRQWDIAAAN